MNETDARRQIIDAIDAIRRPPHGVVPQAMLTVRARERRSGSSTMPRMASLVAVGISVSLIAVLVSVSAMRKAAVESPTSPQPAACALALRTDVGPGLLFMPSRRFAPAALPAASATSYEPRSHRWFATEPQGIAPDGRLVALLDNTKGGRSTLTVETVSGVVLYSRDYVSVVLGWASNDSLLVSTIDTDQLVEISSDGKLATVVTAVGYAGSIWQFAHGDVVWGTTPADSGPERLVHIVRLDLATRTVEDWFQFPADSVNDSGGGPILGLTYDGYPVLPQPKSDVRSAVRVIAAKGVASEVQVGSGDETSTSLFSPLHAIGDSSGLWVTTTDGELYRAIATGPLNRVGLPANVHAYAFGGGCA